MTTRKDNIMRIMGAVGAAPSDLFPRTYDGVVNTFVRFADMLEAESLAQQGDKVRYCYECGHIGEVPTTARDCCPDGSHARYVHPVIAEQAQGGFHAALAQQPVKTPGMAVQALAGEIVEALLADEKDGGYDLTAGMFGANFSALVRRWAAAECNAPAAQPDHRAEFVRVIEFAIKQGTDAREFLSAWLHGDTSEWPEFTAAPAVTYSPEMAKSVTELGQRIVRTFFEKFIDDHINSIADALKVEKSELLRDVSFVEGAAQRTPYKNADEGVYGPEYAGQAVPQPRLAQRKLLMITTAYEQGVGRGIQRRAHNPYAEGTDEHAAWAMGYAEGVEKPNPFLRLYESILTLRLTAKKEGDIKASAVLKLVLNEMYGYAPELVEKGPEA